MKVHRASKNVVCPPWFFKASKTVKSIGESSMFISFMIVLALFTIFSDDIRLSLTTKSADSSFEAVTSIIFFIFVLEILMTCYYKEDYMTLPSFKKRPKEKGPHTWKSWIKRFRFGSFYFWLDCIATFSLMVEVRHSQQLTDISHYLLNPTVNVS